MNSVDVARSPDHQRIGDGLTDKAHSYTSVEMPIFPIIYATQAPATVSIVTILELRLILMEIVQIGTSTQGSSHMHKSNAKLGPQRERP